MRGSVEGDGDVVPGRDARLPDDERVRPRFLRAQHLRVGFFFLTLAPEGVVGDEDLHPETVRVGAEFSDVLEAVAGRLAGPESGTCDIYGIGTAVDGCDADIFVPGGSQQLETLHYFSASSIFLASAPYLGSFRTLV